MPPTASAGSPAPLKYTGPGVLDFTGSLLWLDGSPLIDQVEPYRRDIFTRALDDWEPDGAGGLRRKFNLVLAGRGKKNSKTLDLCLAALFDLLSPPGARS